MRTTAVSQRTELKIDSERWGYHNPTEDTKQDRGGGDWMS